MGIKSVLSHIFSLSRFVALTLSLVWLFIVARYLQVKPQYTTRDYLKLLYNGTKNSGIIRMNTVQTSQQNMNMVVENNTLEYQFMYFNLLNLAQAKSKIDCQSHLTLLIINANSKQAGQNYLSLYKQIQRQSLYCKHQIFELNRKRHLLFSSQLLIEHYAIQVALTIQSLTKQTNRQLTILTFQEGCQIVIKTLQILSSELVLKINAAIFINSLNPNSQIIFENPRNFIKKSQQIMLQDPYKMHVLNKTRLIFISTTKFWDQYSYSIQDQDSFSFLWDGKKLQNTVHLSTRYMKNLYCLMHQSDYFSLSQLPNRLVKFLLIDSNKKRRIQEIQYFFNHGQLYGKVDHQLKNIKNKMCNQARLSKLTKVTKVYKTICLIINIWQKLKQNMNQSILITINKNSYIFNDRFEKIEPFFQNIQYSYYMIQRVKNTRQITIINMNRNQIIIEFQKPYSPISNPLPESFFSSLDPQAFFFKNKKILVEEHKIIKSCPNGNYLIFPQHYQNLYSPNALITSFAVFSVNKLIIEYFKLYQFGNTQVDCYPDFLTQLRFLPKQMYIKWQFQRNLLILVLLCAYVKQQSIFHKFYFYLIIVSVIRIVYAEKVQSVQILLSVILLTLSIAFETIVNIIIHLVKFIQQLVDIKYRKFMIFTILVVSLLKTIQNNFLESYQISAWKLLCISLIFIVNRDNALILFLKLYFDLDFIIYNHNDCLQIGLILLWVYINMHKQLMLQIQRKHQKFNQLIKNINKKVEKKQQNRQKTGILDTILIIIVLLCIDGHSKLINVTIRGYVVFKAISLLFFRGNQFFY